MTRVHPTSSDLRYCAAEVRHCISRSLSDAMQRDAMLKRLSPSFLGIFHFQLHYLLHNDPTSAVNYASAANT